VEKPPGGKELVHMTHPTESKIFRKFGGRRAKPTQRSLSKDNRHPIFPVQVPYLFYPDSDPEPDPDPDLGYPNAMDHWREK